MIPTREIEGNAARTGDTLIIGIEELQRPGSIMKNVKIEVTQPELFLVITLMSDQLFRREFIDPKMPGKKGNPAELAMGKELVLRLKSVFRQVSELN